MACRDVIETNQEVKSISKVEAAYSERSSTLKQMKTVSSTSIQVVLEHILCTVSHLESSEAKLETVTDQEYKYVQQVVHNKNNIALHYLDYLNYHQETNKKHRNGY